MPAQEKNLDDQTYSSIPPLEKHLASKSHTDESAHLIDLPLDNLNRIDKLAKTIHENKIERKELAARRKELERKEQRNKLKQKQRKWFKIDATFGSIAAGGISALYTGVEYLRNFLPPGIANIIMPFFILADVGTAVSAWKIALYNRKIRALKKDNVGKDATWVGSRHSLLRAIFETVWAAIGSAVVLGAIITSTFLAAATAAAFAAFIAPFFMLVLGTRTIFNAASSAFHTIKAQIFKKRAEHLPENSQAKHRLEKNAAHYQRLAKIQAIAASTSAIGFIATTVVMLAHHFRFGFIGVLGGVALGGFMGYLFHGNSKYGSFLKKKHERLDIEMKSLDSKTSTLELARTEKSKKLVGFLPNLADLAKKAVKFAFVPAGLPEDDTTKSAPPGEATEAATSPASEKTKRRLSHKDIQLSIEDADTSKMKHPERTPAMKVVRLQSGNRTVNIPVNSEDGTVITKTRFGIYTDTAPRSAEEANPNTPYNSNLNTPYNSNLKMGSQKI